MVDVVMVVDVVVGRGEDIDGGGSESDGDNTPYLRGGGG